MGTVESLLLGFYYGSLVAAVANLHGARLALTDNAPGLKVELHFPVPQRITEQRPQPCIGDVV